MLAMALASLEPNFVAHSSLVTTDIGVTLFIFLTVYLFWEYVNRPHGRYWLPPALHRYGPSLQIFRAFS